MITNFLSREEGLSPIVLSKIKQCSPWFLLISNPGLGGILIQLVDKSQIEVGWRNRPSAERHLPNED